MPELTQDQVTSIARAAAGHYYKKGVRSYPFEDMFQDAAAQALHAVSRWDPNGRTTLMKYCYIAAERHLHHRITRAISPVSARGHDQTKALGETTHGVSLNMPNDDRKSPSQLSYRSERSGRVFNASYSGVKELEGCQVRAAVRIHVQRLLGDDPDAARVLPVLCGLCDPKDLVSDDFPMNKVRASLQRARRKLQSDMKLYRIAEAS